MNPVEATRLVRLVAATYPTHVTATPETIAAWHWILEAVPGSEAADATRRLCLRDQPFPPTPGEIAAEVARAAQGPQPPSVDAAVGYWLDGDTRHPLIQAAAAKVYWDKVNARKAAIEDFRALYAAEVHRWRETVDGTAAIGAGS